MTAPPWLLPSPWEPITCPRIEARSPLLLEQVVAQHQVETAPRYQIKDVNSDGIAETWCNVYCSDLTKALGCEIPHVLMAGGRWVEARVDMMRGWLLGQGIRSHGWENLPDGKVAQKMADQGQVGVALWVGVQNGRSVGHIATLIPSHGAPGIWVTQAGSTNFARGRVERGFGQRPLEFYAHL